MRKLRTRQHIIEDLGFNHVERQVLLAGYVAERQLQNDYGYDGIINTFTESGEAENGNIFFQLKSTDYMQALAHQEAFAFDLSKRDLELWLTNLHMVLLVLYDAQKEIAFYVDLQTYFKENRILLKNVRKFVRIYISPKSIFDFKIIIKLRDININKLSKYM